MEQQPNSAGQAISSSPLAAAINKAIGIAAVTLDPCLKQTASSAADAARLQLAEAATVHRIGSQSLDLTVASSPRQVKRYSRAQDDE